MPFTIWPPDGNINNSQIAILDLRTNTQTVLLRGGSHARYVSTGHLMFESGGTARSGGTLLAVPFDLRRLTVFGTPVRMVEGVEVTAGGGVQAVVASSGTMVYVPRALAAKRSLVWVARDGVSRAISTIAMDDYSFVRLSPDGAQALVAVRNDAWIFDIATGRQTRLTRDGLVSARLAWHPSGSQVAYTSPRGGDGSQNVWVQPSDGSAGARQLTKLTGVVDVDWWSPDGRVLAIHHHRADGTRGMFMLSMDTPVPELRPFLDDETGAEGASFSPDGRYVAYVPGHTGGYGKGAHLLVPKAGGLYTCFSWRRARTALGA